MVQIRVEQTEDREAIRSVNEKAFGRSQEANIVDKLRQFCDGRLSLVAAIEGHVVGHILFSPVVIESESGVVEGMGLAPLAVLPKYQRQGIGSKLVQEGLRILKNSFCPYVIVVGHPDHYPRFGFEAASKYGIRSQWKDVPNEAFMVLILDRSMIDRVSGVARYRSEFDEAISE